MSLLRNTLGAGGRRLLVPPGDIILDVEGREQEAAISAMHALDVEPDAPARLPPADAPASDEAHDPETGEITTTGSSDGFPPNRPKNASAPTPAA